MVTTGLRSAGPLMAGHHRVMVGRHQWRGGPTLVGPPDDDQARAASSGMSVPPMKLAGT
jgi:hypothetical protein